MDPVSPVLALVELLLAVGTTTVLVRLFGAPKAEGRFTTIDGLRGYLAFFVFLHHSSITYFYLRIGEWLHPPSNLYTHLGRSSVTMFFMITGFLFFTKILDGRTKSIDWLKLFVSRAMRLTPMYVFAMLLLFLVVAIVSHGELREPTGTVMNELVKWLAFTIMDNPDINGLPDTFTIVAGVTWSLPYEWFFYLSLPALALAVGAEVPKRYLVLSLAAAIYLIHWGPEFYHSVSFLGGIAAAVACRNAWARVMAGRTGASVIAVVCIATAIVAFPTPYAPVPMALLSLAFILIACGATLFGTLQNQVSRSLGEVAYSIYLLHGIALYVTFHFVINVNTATHLSTLQYWLVISGITPILISSSFLTFRWIERPAMQHVVPLTSWIRARHA